MSYIISMRHLSGSFAMPMLRTMRGGEKKGIFRFEK